MPRLPVVLTLLVLVLASCAEEEPTTSPPADREEAPEAGDLALEITSATLVTDTAPRSELADPVRAEVVEVVTRFLDLSSVEPMTTGEVGDGIDELLTDEAAERIAGADRPAMVDAGITPSEAVEVRRADVELSGLAAGPDVQLVVARFTLELAGDEGVGVERRGELTVVPVEGEWRIGAYDVTADRRTADGDPSPTSTTAGS